jgi:hypothetical protein
VQFPRATRLVICCRGSAEDALTAMRGMMTKLKLTVNETKTRVAKLPEEKFEPDAGNLHVRFDERAREGADPFMKSLFPYPKTAGPSAT